MILRHGQVYRGDLGDGKWRPVIVISRESLNRGNYVLIAPLTSAKFDRRKGLPNCYPIWGGQFGINEDSVVQAENLTLLDKMHLDFHTGSIGQLNEEAMRGVIHAIGYVIESLCEPE